MNAGLVPDGKEAAIVPFKGKATLMPMHRGPEEASAHQATKGHRATCQWQSTLGDEWDLLRGPPCASLDHVPSPDGESTRRRT